MRPRLHVGIMKNMIVVLGVLALAAVACDREKQGQARVPSAVASYLDVHHLGAGKVTTKAVADAHQKDLAHQAKYQVKYLNYWLDEANGTIMCLTEAPSADAALAVHKEAHGLMPDSIEEVSEGR
jgi:Protein of unknown function (DUF4242)